MTTILTTDNKSRWKQAFLLAVITAGIFFLPFVVYDGGYFVYYGDFNVQQIPFYQLAHNAVRSGDIGWSWHTDLGANFIGSYSFYLLFSPFFWLTLPFPNAVLPYLMAPLLILKTGCSSLTAYLYLERFVRDRRYAVVGGMLYAFSGWMFFNIFFNHFHDVAVFFPLLLLGVERLVCDGKAGLFALLVFICAIVNYWFFVGEVVFVTLYVFVRMTDRDFPMTAKRFLQLALEAALGVGLAACVIFPSVLAITGNPRTGSDELLTGWGFWLYWHEQRQPAVIQSLFFPPEMPARPNFLPDHGAKWASLSGWLPLFGMSGVLAYFFSHKGDWLKKILALSLLFALVPGLNSLFILLNHSYYARWFYMPLLLMAMATVRALEECRHNTAPFSRSLRWCTIVTVIFILMCGLTPNKQDGEWKFGMYQYTLVFWTYAIGSLVLIALTALLVLYLRRSRRFTQLCCFGLALVSAVFGIFYIANGKYSPDRSATFVNAAIRGREQISLPTDPFARIDVYDGPDNIGMFWRQPTIQAFHSIVPPAIMDFYPTVGVTRDVGSRPETDYPALRPLLSVRWLFVNMTGNEDESPMPGYRKHSEQVGYYVYENENYIPMGFGYDAYITRSELTERIDTSFRSNMMLHAVVLEDHDAWRYEDILTRFDLDGPKDFSHAQMERDSAARVQQSAYDFIISKGGFTAYSNLEQETLLFFSVPWEEGWSATVNGTPVDIAKVNIGFMGVRVPAGEAVIAFTYHTPGLFAGLWVSAAFLLLLLLYLLLCRRSKKRALRQAAQDATQPDTTASTLSWETYRHRYGDKKKRAAHLQRTLNEAYRRNIPGTLSQDERTLPFELAEEPPAGSDTDTGGSNATPT